MAGVLQFLATLGTLIGIILGGMFLVLIGIGLDRDLDNFMRRHGWEVDAVRILLRYRRKNDE